MVWGKRPLPLTLGLAFDTAWKQGKETSMLLSEVCVWVGMTNHHVAEYRIFKTHAPTGP